MCSSATRICKRLAVLALVPCLLSLFGCGGPQRVATGGVKGKVTYGENPLPAGCKIVFMHQEKSIPATADVGADGSYTLLFNGKPAVPVGTYKVSITPPPSKEAETPPDPSNPEAYKKYMMGGGAKPKATDTKPPFPKKYQSPETSGVTCTVIEGQETTFDVPMKD